MKPGPYFIDAKDIDIRRQAIVEAPVQAVGRDSDVLLQLQMRDLFARVDAGIRAARALNVDVAQAHQVARGLF